MHGGLNSAPGLKMLEVLQLQLTIMIASTIYSTISIFTDSMRRSKRKTWCRQHNCVWRRDRRVTDGLALIPKFIHMLLLHSTFSFFYIPKQYLFVIEQVTIRTDSMEVAGDIVQDMAGYLGIGELQSSAMFPVELEAFQDVLSKVLTVFFANNWQSIMSIGLKVLSSV